MQISPLELYSSRGVPADAYFEMNMHHRHLPRPCQGHFEDECDFEHGSHTAWTWFIMAPSFSS